MFVFNPGLINLDHDEILLKAASRATYLDPANSDRPFLCGKKPRRSGGVGKEEPNGFTEHQVLPSWQP